MNHKSLVENPEFVKAIASVENSVRLGWDPKSQLWHPHKSLEGGNDTLAYGHKLTDQEIAQDKIQVAPELHVVLSLGLSEANALALLRRDISFKEEMAQRQWDNEGLSYLMTWQAHLVISKYKNLPEKYRGILVDLCFNSYLVKKGLWVWKKAAKAMLEENDRAVLENSITKYKKPGNELWFPLTSRRRRVALALGFLERDLVASGLGAET